MSSIEELITELTAAVKANTAALKGGASSGDTKSSTTSTKTTNNKPPATTTKGKRTVEEASALIQKINDEHGKEEARGVLRACGIGKLAELTTALADKVFKAATEKLAELDSGSDDEAEDEDDI